MFKALSGLGWKRTTVLTTALLVGLVGTVVLAGPASAHDNTMNTPTTVCDSATGTYTVTYTGAGDYDLPSTVTVVSGSMKPAGTTVAPSSLTVQPVKVKGGGYSDPFTFVQTGIPGTAKSASISINEVWTDGVHVGASATATNLKGDCTTSSTPAAPSFSDDVCQNYAPAGGTYTIPATTGVLYKINGNTVAAGTYAATDGSTIAITAVAKPGYTLTGTTSWHHTFTTTPSCTTRVWPASPTFTDDVCHNYAPAGGTYTIPATTGVLYKINGSTVAAGTYPATDGSSVTITAEAKPGYTLSGTASWTHDFKATPSCTTQVQPVAPSFTNDVCHNYAPAGATYTIPATTGVLYKINGSTVAAGTYPATDGSSVTITAVAKPGYTLTGTTTFTHEFSSIPTCTTTVEPTSPTFTDDVCTTGFVPAGATYTIPATTGVIYQIDGKTVAADTYPATDGTTVTVTTEAAEGYTLSGTTTFTHAFAKVPTCTTSAVVSDPKFTDDVCTNGAAAGASYTIPTSTGVVYTVNGKTAAAGTYSATDGSTVTVTAAAAAGYTLTGTTSFTHTFTKIAACTAGLAFTGTSAPATIEIGAGVLAVGLLFLAAAGLGRRRTN
jgi:hypothetical protein